MTRNILVDELNNRGFEASATDSTKNGVIFEGITIKTEGSCIAPVIYTQSIIDKAEAEGVSLDDVVAHIIDIYEEHKTADFDLTELMSRDFVLSHVKIGLQRESTEELIKGASEFKGIESYLYICGDATEDGNFSIKLTEMYLERASVSVAEAWEHAKENTFADTEIVSMAKLMSEMMGFEYDESMERDMPMYVISNKSKIKGASAICDKARLKAFAEEHGTIKLLALPSSVHEMIIIPFSDDMDIEMFSAMVAQVNSQEVAPEERLSDEAIVLEF